MDPEIAHRMLTNGGSHDCVSAVSISATFNLADRLLDKLIKLAQLAHFDLVMVIWRTAADLLANGNLNRKQSQLSMAKPLV